jgi:hypothetical protein
MILVDERLDIHGAKERLAAVNHFESRRGIADCFLGPAGLRGRRLGGQWPIGKQAVGFTGHGYSSWV